MMTDESHSITIVSEFLVARWSNEAERLLVREYGVETSFESVWVQRLRKLADSHEALREQLREQDGGGLRAARLANQRYYKAGAEVRRLTAALQR